MVQEGRPTGRRQGPVQPRLMYNNGQGVPWDYSQAAQWYRKAAQQGFALSQNNLGLMYGKGRGVPRDYVRAHMWHNLAASQGDKGGTKNRDFVAEKMTPADISKAQKLAREWAAKHGKK